MEGRSEEAALAMSILMDHCSTDDHDHHLSDSRRLETSSLYACGRDESRPCNRENLRHLSGCLRGDFLDAPSNFARSVA
jgi:hypothetical protein